MSQTGAVLYRTLAELGGAPEESVRDAGTMLGHSAVVPVLAGLRTVRRPQAKPPS